MNGGVFPSLLSPRIAHVMEVVPKVASMAAEIYLEYQEALS
jgi:hypothetical protein